MYENGTAARVWPARRSCAKSMTSSTEAMHLGITLTPPGFSPRIGEPFTSLAEHPEVDLLDAVDVALRLDPQLPSQLETIK
jgi:hypothetical protein